MKINDLIPTHNELRSPSVLEYFRQQIKAGKKLQPIELIKVRHYPSYDHRIYIHDGHHRAVAAKLERLETLSPDEYNIREVPYTDYLQINFDVGWVTPFDLMSEVRKADFFDFKNEVMDMWKYRFYLVDRIKVRSISRFIESNRNRYVEPRKVWSVGDINYDGVISI